jgi:phage portal protein BeeE
MAEFSLINRISKAYRALTEQKAASPAPDFAQANSYDNFTDYRFRHWSPAQTVDYKREVGNLDGHSLVAAVFNYTGTRLPEAKPVIRRTNEDGDAKIDPNHPLAQLIRRPNKHHIWANYSQAASIDWWIDGGVRFKKVRNIGNQLIELWHIPYYMIRPRWPGDGGTPEVPRETSLDPFLSHYQFDVPGKAPVLWPAGDVLHLKRGPLGEDRRTRQPFAPLVKELYGDDKMAQFTAAIMKNMGIQVPVISPKDKEVRVDATKAAAMKEGWMRKTTGDRAGEPVIMTEPIDFQTVGFSPEQLDLSKLRLIPESRVAAVLQIPAPTLGLLVGLQNGTSYASSEQARQQGYEEVIIPIQSVWEEEINWQLKPEFKDLGEDDQFWFDTSNVRVLEEDKDALVKRESEVFRAGGTTIDQFFTAIGKKPLGAPLGDIRMVPGLASPMSPERLIEMATKPPEETPLTAPTAPVDQEALAKLLDIERLFEGLERQMKDFQLR